MNEPHHYEIWTTWTGGVKGGTVSYETYSREWEIRAEGKPALTGSSDRAFRGDPALYNPEDLLVAALSTCHLLSYLALCARARIEVVSYEDRASGTMSFVEGGYQLTDVLLRPRVRIRDPKYLDRAVRLHENAHHECFIARSVKFPVRNEPEVTAA